ncbi:carbohydrate-binding module family 1 protein [Tulasnella calospora MUT 4182]|uniref:General negative regulator of transcription subunit n=1 Tax=Tulasnella calospora MUT 4182 TaxID=1051891 RepID=A0A0C3QCQ5_9AGAM|nr:carbohydrate-binding module family 1 protein [Tulasnella calospora MUT 4182]
MAARKLQTEIDRTLKKVSEGVELFESIYDKMQSTTNQAQKEKLETDLKTQIKKLQRLRDQIKAWVAGNDIKDKSQLMENRRLIETQMEKFKACEKEMKTKAFSKEGLIAAQKLDPKEREKAEISDWITTMLSELQRQIEQTEAEIAGMQVTTRKKKGVSANGKAEELTALNNRRSWHVGRLEIILRLISNGSITPENVSAIKEDVQYFVESNTEEDFEENEYIYDELNLDEEDLWAVVDEQNHSEDEQSLVSADVPSARSTKERTRSTHDEPPLSPVAKKQPSSAPRRQVEKVEPPKPPVPTPNFAAQPMSSALKAGLPQSNAPVKPVLPPMRYAAAAGGAANPSPVTAAPPARPPATAPTVNTSTESSSPIPAQPPSSIPPATPASTAPSLPQQTGSSTPPPQSPSAASMSISASSPIASSIAPATNQVDNSSVAGSYLQDNSRMQSPAISPQASIISPLVQSMAATTLTSTETKPESAPVTNGVPKAQTPSQSQPPANAVPPPPGMPAPTARAPNGPSQAPGVQSQVPPPNLSANPSPLPQQVQQFQVSQNTAPSEGQTQQRPVGTQPGQPSAQTQRTNLPGSLGDLVSSFEAVKQKAAQRMANPDQMHKLLEVAMNGTPQATDTEKPKYYVPRNQYNTPPYYPQTPLAILSSPALFAQLDVETLFYVFYFLPGTYQQYLAAQQLKNQSWRFHVKYLTWFQRHSEPQAITEEYEQGVYVYFDWEGSWCQRKKSDFRFEYRYLSED